MRSVHWIAVPVTLALLTACNWRGDDDRAQAETEQSAQPTQASDNLADSMASRDPAEGEQVTPDIPDSEERPMMQAQVVLDRVGFGPGVIDGKMGMSTENALMGFQEANDLDTTGKLDEPTKQALAKWSNIPATRVVTIPASWGELDYEKTPDGAEAQSKLDRLGYQSLDEKLAERFHTTVEVLKQLNPGGKPAGMQQASASGGMTPSPSPSTSASATPSPSPTPSASGSSAPSTTDSFFTAGQQIRVPNIGGDRIAPGAVDDPDWQQTLTSLGVGTDQPQVDKIVVSKAGKTLKAYQGEKLVALFTVSSGSSEFPLPLGEWKIVGEAYNPPFDYSPEVLTGGRKSGEDYTLPPGPNGPVGVVWIDLSKEHYGIHGTPDPSTIGRAQSHGCVRLTNWDAARLAGMVSQKTQVIFEA